MIPNSFKHLTEEEYNKIVGTDWPSYNNFVYSDFIETDQHNELKSFFKESDDIKTVISKFESYKNLLNEHYFNVCKGKRVLEIGPNNGIHSKIICENEPLEFTVIEADSICVTELEKYKIDNIIVDDVFQVLNKKLKYDVVICLGVLYHIPHALHLLELIVNYNDPDYILLDCVNDARTLEAKDEKVNISGNRQVIAGWKDCGLNIVLPLQTINAAMENLGYICVQKHNLKISEYFPKSNSWLSMYNKKS
jgi:2-polyprenyl-3-methyl-5-hydroxy-6-metoxy-1,4-benzoquinol methylase